MSTWVQGGIVRKAVGCREHEGTPRPTLTASEREAKGRSLSNKRKFKTIRGKSSYQ